MRTREIKNLPSDQQLNEDRKQELFGWVDFIRNKKNMMVEQLINVNDDKNRVEA